MAVFDFQHTADEGKEEGPVCTYEIFSSNAHESVSGKTDACS